MPLLLPNGKAIFVNHIPRTGGTAIEANMRRKGRLSLYADRAIPGLGMRPQQFEAEIHENLLSAAFISHSFTAMRDPLGRMKSDYHYRARPADGIWSWLNRATGGHRQRVKLGKRRRLLTFDEWAVKSIAGYHRNPMIGDNHIRPQVDFLSSGMTIFDFAQGLEPVFRWIDQITETKASPGALHINRSNGGAPEVSDRTHAEIAACYNEDFARLRGSETTNATCHDPDLKPQLV